MSIWQTRLEPQHSTPQLAARARGAGVVVHGDETHGFTLYWNAPDNMGAALDSLFDRAGVNPAWAPRGVPWPRQVPGT